MPKLRNGNTDIEKFADWLGRKCRNHAPLAELNLPKNERAKLPRMYKPGRYDQGGVYLLADGREEHDTLILKAGGRGFKITVEEIDPTEVPEKHLKEVGF